jgi:hypothetical protein
VTASKFSLAVPTTHPGQLQHRALRVRARPRRPPLRRRLPRRPHLVYRRNGTGFGIPWIGRSDLPNFGRPPAKNFNLRQADADFQRTLDDKGAYLDHRFSKDWFGRLGFARMDFGPSTKNNENVGNDYRHEVNRLLPNGAPNPNVGKPNADLARSRQHQDNMVVDFRALSTFKFEVPKIFGLDVDLKQRLAGIGGWRIERVEMWQRQIRWMNNPAQPVPTNAANQVRNRIYYDQPTPDFVFPSGNGIVFKEITTAFASYNYRSRDKYRATFELNIANLLDDDQPQWTSPAVLDLNALPAGNLRQQLKSGFTQSDLRKFTLTTTLSF